MSDHFSGPSVIADPSVDITDFYAFPSPERPGNIVMIMDVFPMATPRSFFSDIVTYRFRLRPLTREGSRLTHGAAEHVIAFTFDELPDAGSGQTGRVTTSDGRNARLVVGEPFEQDGMRVFVGLASDPFFMDVEAAIRTDVSGRLSYDTAANTAQDFDCLSIVVEIPASSIVERFGGVTLVGGIAESLVTRRGNPVRIERVGRPEIKNVILGNPMRAELGRGVELRDLYNREDAFALSPVYRSLYEARLDANLAFFDGLDDDTAWPLAPDGRHPLRDLLIDDYLVLDLAKAFAPGAFLEIERSLVSNRPHTTAGGRWLDDDILDDLLTFLVNGDRGPRLGDGVDAPTKAASLIFPYVREPNKRTDIPVPAFLRG